MRKIEPVIPFITMLFMTTLAACGSKEEKKNLDQAPAQQSTPQQSAPQQKATSQTPKTETEKKHTIEELYKTEDPDFNYFSTVGTTYLSDVIDKKLDLIPRGAAVLSSSGILEKKGVKYIIHAAPGSKNFKYEPFIPTFEAAKLSVKNSLILANRFGLERVAIPFIGGKIFFEDMRRSLKTLTLQELADAIVEAAVENRGNCEIVFVSFQKGRVIESYLHEATKNPKYKELIDRGIIQHVFGNIADPSLHEADVIVNAANTEVEFGKGVSGAICEASGCWGPDKSAEAYQEVVQKTNERIVKFNTKLKEYLKSRGVTEWNAGE